MRPEIKPGADVKSREDGIGKIAIRKYITPLRICFLRGDIRAVFGSRIETGMNRQDAKEGGEGEELLFYPQMTQMTQIFLGRVVRGNKTCCGRNAKGAKYTAS